MGSFKKKGQKNYDHRNKQMANAEVSDKKRKRESLGDNFHKKFKSQNPNNDEEEDLNYQNNTADQYSAKYLLVKPGNTWFSQLPPNDPNVKSTFSPNLEQSLKKEAEFILKEDCIKYQRFLEKRNEKSDFSWIKTILKSGTLSDKISAHTLLIQDSPIHNFTSLEILVSMVNPKGKRECLMAIDCLKDLFLSDLLIEEKKLRIFSQHPLHKLDKLSSGNIQSRKKRLLLWHFEERLKDLYSKFVKNVELMSRDTIEKTKQKAVTVMQELLRYNPEQEQFLLEHLVNKIGDPIPKVGSHVCYLMGQLVGHHRNMMAVVVQEVERLLFRPNVSERVRYYCLCFFNQLIFDHEKSNIAGHLITMYFGLFKMCIKKGEVNSKMMSALLTGVARAYPYAKLKNNVIMEQLDAMFRLVHLVSFNISVQALMLIFQVLDSNDSVSDRFYSALYRKLLDPNLKCSTRQSMLLNLIYRALKKDSAQVRIKAFVKRLVQIALNQASNLQCGILMLISELSKIHPDLLETKESVLCSESDSEEHYDDMPDEDEDNKDVKKISNTTKSSSSWLHRQTQRHKLKHNYDPQDRNPLHAGAEYSNVWELCFLQKSFHPSVSLFAHQVASGNHIKYNGDPLEDFTIIRFLDRFVYRNPKKQPESAKSVVHKKIFGKKIKNSNSQKLPVLSEAYVSQREQNVPVEEKFIYKYLQQRKMKKENKDNSDVESVNSDEFESLLNDIHPEDEGKDTLDFARELSKNSKNKQTDEQSESELDSLESESDMEFSDDDEFKNAFEDYDDDINNKELDVNEEDFIDFDFKGKSSQKQKREKKKKGDDDIMFASADEFGALLEENSAFNADTTSEAFINTDKSDVKQLAWEKRRHQYISGTDWKSRKQNSRKKFFKKRK